MGIYFKKQSRISFNNQEEVHEYWRREGTHHLNNQEIDAMIE